MPSGYDIILVLKIAVSAVTLLLVASLIALAWGRVKLHGRLNLLFFVLTMSAVLAFEVLLRIGPYLEPGWSVTNGWTLFHRQVLRVHLCFVIPLLFVMPLMLLTGLKHWRRIHIPLGILFALLWAGMLVTGIGLLPHAPVEAWNP
jgi:D-alanyl-lipoteichoic acid acyltransferase DltB (MBOAT superfamily)